MRIDLIEHSDLVRGVAEVEETPEGVRSSRMTEAAAEFFGQTGELRCRTGYTAGVRISLVTDSSYLALRLHQGMTEAWNPYRVDVLVDRSECHTFGPDEAMEEFFFSLELPDGGDHEVEVLLPASTEVLVGELELADGSLFRPLYCSDERMLFLGDAITMGMGVSSPLRSYAASLGAELGIDYLNWGVAGAELRAGIGELALELEWQSVVIACGANDYVANRVAASCAAELDQLLAQLTSRPGVRIYLLTPLAWNGGDGRPNLAGDTLEDFRREFTRVGSAYSEVRVCSGPALLPAEDDYFTEDGRCPSDDGMALLAENLCRAIRRMR